MHTKQIPFVVLFIKQNKNHILLNTYVDNQWNILIQCETLFTSQFFTNYNKFQKYSDIQTKKEQPTSPTKKLSLVMSPSINTRSGSSDNITTSPEAPTITTPPPPPFVSKCYFDTTIQAIFNKSYHIFESFIFQYDPKYEELKQLREK